MLVNSLKYFELKLIIKFRTIHIRYSTLLKKLLFFFEKNQNNSKNELRLIIINDELYK